VSSGKEAQIDVFAQLAGFGFAKILSQSYANKGGKMDSGNSIYIHKTFHVKVGKGYERFCAHRTSCSC